MADRISREAFDVAFNEMVISCGVNPEYKKKQATAWFDRWSHYSDEVIKKAFNFAVQNTKKDFPTFAEVNEAIRRAAFVCRRDEESQIGENCHICGGAGLISLAKLESGYVPIYRSMDNGRVYVFKCICTQGQMFSAAIPVYYGKMIAHGEEGPRFSAVAEMMSRDQVRRLINECIVSETPIVNVPPMPGDDVDCPF